MRQFTIVAMMVAITLAVTIPAMAAQEESCDEVVAKLQEALNSRDIDDLQAIDEGEMVALAKENPQCITLELLPQELVEQLPQELVEQLNATADELIGPDEGNEE